MKIWIDAQLSPHLALWLTDKFEGIEAISLSRLGLRDAEDSEIFYSARAAEAVVLTKDRDFVELLLSNGPPPKVIWLTCGNTSNVMMRQILGNHLLEALAHLNLGSPLVELGNKL